MPQCLAFAERVAGLTPTITRAACVHDCWVIFLAVPTVFCRLLLGSYVAIVSSHAMVTPAICHRTRHGRSGAKLSGRRAVDACCYESRREPMNRYALLSVGLAAARSEERRVGKECRSRW